MKPYDYKAATSAEIAARITEVQAQLDAHRDWLQQGPQLQRDLESELISAQKIHLPAAIAKEAKEAEAKQSGKHE
jgi:hypothetical protein